MFLSREEVRALDRRAIEEFGVPGVVLMENAGRGTAELLISLGIRGKVVAIEEKGVARLDHVAVLQDRALHRLAVEEGSVL